MTEATFPARYEPLERLGKGGGGEVWSARDRVTGVVVALKLLPDGADEPEMHALVREATLLSGIEGLGVPRVLHFGRLPKTDRAFMVRELVEGRSLADLMAEGAPVERCLSAIAQAADLVTQLHRALLLHGDIKPANIIVAPDGSATLVDLGLAAPWQEGGSRPEGLTPRYAAPELFRGEALTPQAEVFALGASVAEIVHGLGGDLAPGVREAVSRVADRATEEARNARFPSADEFAVALRSAANLPRERAGEGARVWTISGIDRVSTDLYERVSAMTSGQGLLVVGPRRSGRSTLIRRLSWSLGVGGAAVCLIEAGASVAAAVEAALRDRKPKELVVLVDDASARSPSELEKIAQLRRDGAVLVMVVASSQPELPGETFALFEVPALSATAAAQLVDRMIPSLSDRLVRYIVARAGALPGLLRQIVTQLEGRPVVSIEDIERHLDEVPVPSGARIGIDEIHRLLDRGLFDHAAEMLAAYDDDNSAMVAIARAKLATGRGDPRSALRELKAVESDLPEEGEVIPLWHLQKARAQLRTGDYDDAELSSGMALTRLGVSLLGEVAAGNLDERNLAPMVAEALAVSGLAQSLAGRHDDATRTLRRSVDVARGMDEPRVLAVALGSLAFALQRTDKLEEAQQANEEALEVAERAGDAGHVATTRLNLAGIAQMRGDTAASIRHLEAAVDMGRRSGRQSTVRQALLNLASQNLHLGRHARAKSSIDALVTERDSLGAVQQAQLFALEAESAAIEGDYDEAQDKCNDCAVAYEQLRRPVDAAEAVLERVLFRIRAGAGDAAELQEELFRAEALLSDSGVHRALLLTARGRVAMLASESEQAEAAFDEAIEHAKEAGQRGWLWRAYEARAELRVSLGNHAGAAADRREAVAVLHEMAAKLPRDLREVFWNDPRRRALRDPATALAAGLSVSPSTKNPLSEEDLMAPTQLGQVVPAANADRLARVLEVNRAIAGEYDLDRLLEKVTDHAIALLSAERGFVLLKSRSGADHLSVHAARDQHGDDPHARFSQSIAERVVQSGEPFVAIDALRDERVSDYVSVHSLMLKSVACVPIRSRTGVMGALYLETRLRPGAFFRDELPTLAAFADQVAIAIETARLVNENRQRAEELEEANKELEAARAKLEQSLGRRTEQLESTRRSLRSAREVLRGHFGYKGIVGTSGAMRRCYAIIDRVKDADVPVLITGESGTGKEVIARTIHSASPRAKQRFVGINCGAIPEHLLESELFGHVRGAFTGADRDKKGLFRELDKGTILLDEIGEMPQKMQAGLLRVLQEKKVRPVGGTEEVTVNTRVIAATHRDLSAMVAAGTFREDLFYRLNVIPLPVPSLRERSDDIPLLIDHFLRIFGARYSRDKRTVSRDALKLLTGYSWPGNVRQLENVLLNAWILSDSPELEPDDFELPDEKPSPVSVSQVRSRPVSLDDAKQLEKDRILDALEQSGWNRAKAAKIIGMPRRTFYRRLKKYDIQ